MNSGSNQDRTAGERPVVAVTIGDAAGIGPEIALKAIADPTVRDKVRCVAVGDRNFLLRAAARFSPELQFVEFARGGSAPEEAVEVFDAGPLPEEFEIGVDAASTGRASAECVKAAVSLCVDGLADAMATAPISKKAIKLGGYDFPGHTEFIAELTNTLEFAMSFFAGRLRVLLISTHVPLRRAVEMVTAERLKGVITFADRELGKVLGRRPSIAVAGLNPHASEGGLFGNEEANEMVPAIQACKGDLGINVSGPYSPDTIFRRGYDGEFDAVIACYHDQATIAVKSLSFGFAVNVTLGLPIIRTSVDHGTAFDIAGKGIADPSSMKAAILLAGELARTRHAAV
ncbi:MAG: 4-hydroxythreonine-4-phosphate dehydrogenase PdxA [Pyrinomonadaceae bacterium]